VSLSGCRGRGARRAAAWPAHRPIHGGHPAWHDRRSTWGPRRVGSCGRELPTAGPTSRPASARHRRVPASSPPILLRSPLANTNVESGAGSHGGLVDCGAVWEMEVVWPSGAVLRKKASNRHEGRWLKTVVLSVVGKGVAGPRQVWTGKMSDERKFSAVDVSKLN
jgi:hypothetical protein